jgi:hypothetical protein
MFVIDEWVSGRPRDIIVFALLILFPVTPIISVFVAHYLTIIRDKVYRDAYKSRKVRGITFLVVVGIAYLPITIVFSDKIIVVINKHLYNVNAHVMGLMGFVQDFFIPVPFLIVIFIAANWAFKIVYSGIRSQLLFFVIYYGLSHFLFKAMTYPLGHNIY